MDKPLKNYSELWMAITFVICIAWYISSNKPNTSIDPHVKIGIDTMIINDTAYVIKYTRDTSFYLAPETEPKDDPH